MTPVPRSPLTTRPLPRRTLLALTGGLGLAGLAGGCAVVPSGRDAVELRPNKEPATGRRTEIEIYNNFGADVGAGIVQCATAFEEQQDEIAVRVTFAPSSGEGTGVPQKLLTALAGGQAPDVAFCDASVAPAWTRLGMMTDLTPYFEADGLSLEDFFPACAASMVYQDRVWSMTWDADANFPFFWNKTLFEECGLDPERPPRTIEEVDACAGEIDRIEGGRATRVGILPWEQYGGANSLLTWGYSFGGSFWQPGTNQVTPDDEHVVAALSWMTRSAERVGGPDAVSVAPPSLSAHPFSTGNIGMSCLVTPNLLEILQLNPDMEVGATLLPYQGPGASQPGEGAWLGGWSGFIPQSAAHPEAAWQFLRWLAVSDEGTRAQWENIGFPVGYAAAAVNQTIADDPVAGIYHQSLTSMVHTRPLITVNNFYNQRLEEKVELAVYGRASPEAAMRQVKDLTNREADRFERVG
ncbi:extracellular solute-binding protein [Auraticoccus sp. F435]|uniref:Extracellular solute-binding protein n=1 Tax=Auraticoccus cholistanensis TaxID=2656650 RepID=A0A6A9V209_9ACTN|nr:ABC transporter substrate-binding protein [Auraticoccus cholistanensis]MVA77666.1 extracellular solute-binding protein [Auraticoccus cholistanensis]